MRKITITLEEPITGDKIQGETSITEIIKLKKQTGLDGLTYILSTLNRELNQISGECYIFDPPKRRFQWIGS